MTERQDYRTQKGTKDRSGAAIRLGVLGVLGAAAIAGGAYVWSADVEPLGEPQAEFTQDNLQPLDQYASTTPQTATDATSLDEPPTEAIAPAAAPEPAPQRAARVTPRRTAPATAPLRSTPPQPAPVTPPSITTPPPIVSPDTPPEVIMPADPMPLESITPPM